MDTEEHTRSIVARHATPAGEVMFTVYTVNHENTYSELAEDLAAHMAANLMEIQRLDNTMLLTYDVDTFYRLWEKGIPCVLDRFSTQPQDLPGLHFIHNRAYCFCKTCQRSFERTRPEIENMKKFVNNFADNLFVGSLCPCWKENLSGTLSCYCTCCVSSTVAQKSYSVALSWIIEGNAKIWNTSRIISLILKFNQFPEILLSFVIWRLQSHCFVTCHSCPGQYSSKVPSYYQKHAWTLQLMKWNYTAVFIEVGEQSCLSFTNVASFHSVWLQLW